MTLEQLDAIRAVKAEIAAARKRLLDGQPMTNEERNLEQERLLGLTKKQLDLEEAANALAPHPKAAEIAKLSPQAAASRAAELRKRPEYYDGSARDKDGNLVATLGQRAALIAEHTELMKRAGEAEGGTP